MASLSGIVLGALPLQINPKKHFRLTDYFVTSLTCFYTVCGLTHEGCLMWRHRHKAIYSSSFSVQSAYSQQSGGTKPPQR